MPKVLDKLVSKLKAKGVPQDKAYAVATSQLQKSGKLKKGTAKLATKAVKAKATKPKKRTK